MPFDQDSGQVFDEYIVKPQAPRPRSLSRVYYQYSPETPEKSTDDSWVFNPTHWHPRSRVRHKPRHLKLDGENDAQDVYQYADKRYCWDGMGRMSHPRNCDQDDHGAESEVGSYNLGPRCLFEMALQAVANGIDTVDCSFENMPYTVVLPIFNFMSARGMSLHAWKLLQKSVFRASESIEFGDYNPIWRPCMNPVTAPLEDLVETRRTLLCTPFNECSPATYTFPTLVNALKSPDLSFVTRLVLSIPWKKFTMNEMFCLTDMKNLGILEIRDLDRFMGGRNYGEKPSNERWTDHLIAGWASKPDPFPILRILTVSSPYCTEKSLQHLSIFPSLAIFDLYARKQDWPKAGQLAEQAGWELEPHRTAKSSGKYKCPGVMSAEYLDIATLRNPSAQENGGMSLDIDDSCEWWSQHCGAHQDNAMLRYHCLGEFIHENRDIKALSPDDNKEPYLCKVVGELGLPFRPMISAFITTDRTGCTGTLPRGERAIVQTFIRSEAFSREEGTAWDPSRPSVTKVPTPRRSQVKRCRPPERNLEMKVKKKQRLENMLTSLSVGSKTPGGS